jgi:hypothetical protein
MNLETGSSSACIGTLCMQTATSSFNSCVGTYCLGGLTSGANNTSAGYEAGEYISGGSTANSTGAAGVFLGYESQAQANGDTNEIVIGSTATGGGSNSATLGNTSIILTTLNGTIHNAGTAPSASAGTIVGTNAGGHVAGLSAATTVTITFANLGWGTWDSCVAISSVSATQPYLTSLSLTAVTFTFPTLTGTLYYHCDGN